MSSAFGMDRRRLLVGAAGAGLGAGLSGARAAEPASITVETTCGKLRGAREGGVSVFRGVSYGADTAATRFASPAPAKPWAGVRDALQFGPRAPQSGRAGDGGYSLSSSWKERSPSMGEDCLVLNVWTPATDHGRRSVMVWFHGGGFGAGSGAADIYDGARLAADEDVVIVTLNHRLGPFGYLYLKEVGGEAFADSGNAGMLDLVLALQWVRDNIATFGGDPKNVTVFGESGGGAKVSILMGMPAAKGLYHKAVIQSGAYPKAMSPEAGTKLAERVIATLGLTRGKIDAIRTMPTAPILAAIGDNSKMINRIAYVPVRDGRSLPNDPFAPAAQPFVADVPLLIGNTRWEYIYQFGMEERDTWALTWDTLPAKLADTMKMLSLPGDAKDVVAHYRATYPDRTAPYVFFSAVTDARMLRNSITIAERKAAQPAPVFMYVIDWLSPVEGGRWMAPHVLDVPLIFKTVDKAGSLMGAGPVQDRLSLEMSSAWAAFARTGDPSVKALPRWPRYEPGRRATMLFDTVSKVADDPAPDVRRYWPAA